MAYQLDLDSIRENFKFEKGIKHNPSKRTRILPYTTKFIEEKHNFVAVIGEFIRLIGRKKMSKPFDVESLLDIVLETIKFGDITDRSQCKQLIRSLFLNENQQLHLFHPQVLYYIDSVNSENKKLASFLYHVLWGGKRKLEEDLIKYQPQDVMTTLLFNALPQLDDSEEDPQKYDIFVKSISEQFINDFTWLIKKPELFILHVEKIISYYYFFYVSQFAIQSEAMFETEKDVITPIYFNLEWESLSQTRTSYEKGWKRIEGQIGKLFSHINCLEFLNHKIENTEDVYSYKEIGEIVRGMSMEDQSQLETDINILIEEYKGKLSDDSKFEKLSNIGLIYKNDVLNKMHLFFNIIDHQFKQSSRNKPYQEYQKWFVHFCKIFLKSRGRLGKSLNLNADYLLFLTKLILKDEEKIRLKRLFDEFELRGMVFDRDTQAAIVGYFESINILEKKSDSGDAIYVKAFL